ncbi:hypothetical protein XELAEV_18001698mg [Xenopus laevis]|nr:hypothetical protein XELAEV_18001698mg [Xenopus laevis]
MVFPSTAAAPLTSPLLLQSSLAIHSNLLLLLSCYPLQSPSALYHQFDLIYARTVLSHPVCSCSTPAPSSLFLLSRRPLLLA